MLSIPVLPASALRCVPRAPAGEGLGEVGEGIFASPPVRRGTSLLCFCSLAGAEFSAARLGGCGRISHHFLSGVGREVWVHRYVFTQLTYAFLLVFPIRRGCAQCARTLSICYFRRSWVFLTSNFSWNCVRCACAGCPRQPFWPGQACVGGWGLLSDLLVRQENGFLWLFCV